MDEAYAASEEALDSWHGAWGAIARSGGGGGGDGGVWSAPARLLLEASTRALLEEGGSGLSGGMKVLYILASIALVVVSGLMVNDTGAGLSARSSACYPKDAVCPAVLWHYRHLSAAVLPAPVLQAGLVLGLLSLDRCGAGLRGRRAPAGLLLP